MYQLHVTVTQIMDMYDVRASLLSDEGGNGWERVADTSDTLALAPEEETIDPFVDIINVLCKWSVRTIRG